MTYRDFENIQRSNEEFDGLVVLLSLWAYDNHASYHLHNWDPADDERMMMAIYYAEQVHPFPRYKNDLAKFKADWAAQAYDPGGASLTFAPADVEELEVLCEEAAEPEPEAEPALAAGALEPPQPASRADVMARASVSARNLFFIG